jgi:putative Mg2+ transporter-C (MgtC) family protein
MSLTNVDVCLRIGISFLCGLLIGIERQLNNSVAGIHTNVLVCVGSCLFIFVGQGIGEINSPSRIAAQIVTGIGFIGSGIIIKDNNNIKGLNTAATIWCTGAIGSLCGCGFWITGACSSILIAICNYILRDAHIRTCLKFLEIKNEEPRVEIT